MRGLQKAGVRVKVVMTEHATKFVTPLTFRALTHEEVAVGMFDDAPSDPIHHISLAEEADLFLIAPATVNVIAKIANGICDDLLTTTACACTAPLIVCPAANVHMYESPANQRNMGLLTLHGAKIIEADAGYLACGDVGKGRLADVDEIVRQTLLELGLTGDMRSTSVLITAGPTIEPIDPVRYITNFSSGKTGYALAKAAHERGADVTIVSGPVAVEAPEGVHVVHVRTAREMRDAVAEAFPVSQVRYRHLRGGGGRFASQKGEADHKLKKGVDDAALQTIELAQNPDIPGRDGRSQTRGSGGRGLRCRNQRRDRQRAQAHRQACRHDYC